MGEFEFVLGIIFIVMAASVIRTWINARRLAGGRSAGDAPRRGIRTPARRGQAAQGAIQVLERITVEKEKQPPSARSRVRDR